MVEGVFLFCFLVRADTDSARRKVGRNWWPASHLWVTKWVLYVFRFLGSWALVFSIFQVSIFRGFQGMSRGWV